MMKETSKTGSEYPLKKSIKSLKGHNSSLGENLLWLIPRFPTAISEEHASGQLSVRTKSRARKGVSILEEKTGDRKTNAFRKVMMKWYATGRKYPCCHLEGTICAQGKALSTYTQDVHLVQLNGPIDDGSRVAFFHPPLFGSVTAYFSQQVFFNSSLGFLLLREMMNAHTRHFPKMPIACFCRQSSFELGTVRQFSCNN